MKILLMVRVKSNAVPNAEMIRIHKQFIRRLQENGKAEAVYTCAGSNNGMSIVNVDSFEELNDLMIQTPAIAICDIDVYPLADFHRQMDRMIQICEVQQKTRTS
jgi:muconolactone delta-isomerase